MSKRIKLVSILPNTHALLIGIVDYQQVNRLPQQVCNDVQDLQAALIDPRLYSWLTLSRGLALSGKTAKYLTFVVLFTIQRLPSRQRMLTTPDLTHPYRSQTELARLARALQQPLFRRG